MADNVTIPASGTGDATPVVRTIQKGGASGPEAQVVVLDRGGSGTEDVAALGDATNGIDVDPTRGIPDVTTLAGTIPAVNGTVTLALRGLAGAAVRISGTWVATLVFEITIDGTNYIQVDAFDLTQKKTIVSTTANGSFSFTNLAGASSCRIRASAFTSGTVNVDLRATVVASSYVEETDSDTGTQSSVASTVTTNTTILAANVDRKGAAIYNDSTSTLFLLLGSATESATVFTVKLPSNGYYEVPLKYKGIIKGHWVTANGSARITEWT